MVAEQRLHRGPEARVARADADAEQHHHPEVLGDPAGGGEGAEHAHAGGDDLGPVDAVGHQRQRQAEHRVEQREAQALDQAELGVGEVQVHLEPGRRRGDALPIGQIQHVDQQKHEQQPGAVALAESLAGGPRLRRGLCSHGGVGRTHEFLPRFSKAHAHQARRTVRLSNGIGVRIRVMSPTTVVARLDRAIQAEAPLGSPARGG